MPTEQQLADSIRAHAADGADTFGREVDIAASVLLGVRAHRRRRAAAGTAAAVALVSVASYVGIHAVANTSATPPTDQTSDNPSAGHTVLPPDILNLRGQAVADALDLPPVSESSPDCAGTIAASAPDHAFCVDVGNAPDDWLVAALVTDSNRSSGPLRSVGIAWDSDRPAPPPVVVDLVEAKVVALGDMYGNDSAQYNRATVNLDFARTLWDDQAGWEAAGWNDTYWGDPWWPTDT